MEKIIGLIKEIREEAKSHDRCGTASPLYVVQTLESRLASEHDYDEETLCIEVETFPGNVDEVLEQLIENDYLEKEEVEEECLSSMEEISEALKERGYYPHITYTENYYRDVAYFLLKSEAEKYMEYQSHNLSSPRVYAKYLGYANKGKLAKLIDLINEEE